MKKILSLLFVPILVLAGGIYVIAHEIEYTEDNMDDPVSCIYCEDAIDSYICMDECQIFDHESHKSLNGEVCSVTYYRSRLALLCNNCSGISEHMEHHLCYELHSSCGLGKYVICLW